MVANSAAASQVNAARSSAIEQQQQLQQALNNESTAVTNQSQNRFANFGGQQAATAKTLGALYGSGGPAAAPTTGGSGPTTPSSNVMVQEQNKQNAKVGAYNTQQDGALATLRSFGDTMGDMNRGVALDNSQLGILNNFKQGDAALLPLQLDQASRAGQGMQTLGDFLKGAGMVTGIAGLGGASNALFSTTPVITTTGTESFNNIGDLLSKAQPQGYFPRTFPQTFPSPFQGS